MLTSAPRIFLVEDNPSDRVLTHERLRDRGLELLGWADTAQGGADRLAGVEADCVLVDLTLPDAQGTEAVKRLLEAAGGAAIIVLSGDPRQSAAISALRQGATDFVSKDASADTLAHAVREAVGAVRYERRLAAVEERRREAEDRFRVAFEHAPIGMALADAGGGGLRANAALGELLGRSVASLEGRPLTELTHPDDRARVRRALDEVLGGEESVVVEQRLLHADGHEVWAEVHATLARPGSDQPLLLLHVQDVTARRQLHDHLRHLADHDQLTGLLNRRGFEAELERHLSHGLRYGLRGAVVMLDVDGLKGVNDTLGHAAGDEVIAAVAKALLARLRDSDVIGRLGGDEFAILLPNAGAAGAAAVVKAVVNEIRERSATVAQGGVSASAGIALCRDGDPTVAALLARADDALYRAKEAGRSGHVVHAAPQPVA